MKKSLKRFSEWAEEGTLNLLFWWLVWIFGISAALTIIISILSAVA